jgi:hypothetical protein
MPDKLFLQHKWLRGSLLPHPPSRVVVPAMCTSAVCNDGQGSTNRKSAEFQNWKKLKTLLSVFIKNWIGSVLLNTTKTIPVLSVFKSLDDNSRQKLRGWDGESENKWMAYMIYISSMPCVQVGCFWPPELELVRHYINRLWSQMVT